MNTVTVPQVQTTDRNINQLQKNITTAIQPLANMVNQVTIIGMIIQATINLDQLQRQAGPGWVPCDGKSIVGSSLNKLSGQLTAPTIANSYIRID